MNPPLAPVVVTFTIPELGLTIASWQILLSIIKIISLLQFYYVYIKTNLATYHYLDNFFEKDHDTLRLVQKSAPPPVQNPG